MDIERTIEETASGTATAILVECTLCCIDDTLVTSKSRIGIRAEHQDLMAAHFNLRTLLSLNRTEIGINVSLHVFLRLTIKLVFFL